LEAELIRDSMLQLSCQLDLASGGPSVTANGEPDRPAQMPARFSDNSRRSIYLPVVRNDLPEIFQVFDFADPHAVAAKRHTTTAATQALFMMNSDFVTTQARKWVEALFSSKATSDAQRVELAYQQAFGRTPEQTEANRAIAFINDFQNGMESEKHDQVQTLLAWQSFCQALMAATEFRFLD
jgi:hypothetical protein